MNIHVHARTPRTNSTTQRVHKFDAARSLLRKAKGLYARRGGGGEGAPPAGTRRAVHGVAVVGVAEIGHDLTDQVVLANSAASHGLDRLHLSNRSQRNAKHRIRRL